MTVTCNGNTKVLGGGNVQEKVVAIEGHGLDPAKMSGICGRTSSVNILGLRNLMSPPIYSREPPPNKVDSRGDANLIAFRVHWILTQRRRIYWWGWIGVEFGRCSKERTLEEFSFVLGHTIPGRFPE